MKAVIFIVLLMFQSSAFAVDEDKWDSYIQSASAATGIEFDLIKAVIKQESAFRDDIGNGDTLSSAGAIGAMQIIPTTGADLGYSAEDLKDPEKNIMAGAEYLKWLSGLSYINGDPVLMAAAYNAGPGAVQQYGGVPPYSETVPYVQNVAQNYANYSGTTLNTSSLPSPTVNAGTPSIASTPVDFSISPILGADSPAVLKFEQITRTPVSNIKNFFKGTLGFLTLLLGGILILFFWMEGVSQDDESVFAGAFFNSMRALLLMSVFFVFFSAL